MDEIRKLINSCISILKSMRIDYNTPIGPRTNALMLEVRKLIPLLEKEQPHIANILKQSLGNIVSNQIYINAYVFGDIRTTLSILDEMYTRSNKTLGSDNTTRKRGVVDLSKTSTEFPSSMTVCRSKIKKKIFISHSSKDKRIVEKLVDHILLLGIGLSPEDIFCTSIEDLGIKNGEDIRKHIHTNIQTADFSILLISNNYKKSEICMNEMGAVWAYNNNVRYYLLPDSNFDTIGWLCNPNQAEKLFDSIALDALKMELSTYYSLEDKGTAWSRQRETFLKGGLSELKTSSVKSIEYVGYENGLLDPLLDCNVYELKLLKFLENEPNASVLDITKHLKLSKYLLDKTIQSLTDKGFLVREKIGHKTRWIVMT